jgi:hypothetical protein
MRPASCLLTLLGGVSLVLLGAAAPDAPKVEAPKADAYAGIPAGFDFPASQSALINFRDTQNVSKMRHHIWMVFAGINQPAPGGGPIWETWFPKEDTFTRNPPRKDGRLDRVPDGLDRFLLADARLERPLLPLERSAVALQQPARRRPKLEKPRQLEDVRAPGQSMLAFVLFNQEAHEHIRANRLHLKSELTKINEKFSTDDVAVEKRNIKGFPRKAVSLKVIWEVVSGSEVTALPVWDGTPMKGFEEDNGPQTWKRCVAVDPTRDKIPDGETKDVEYRGVKRPKSRVVPLSSFYHFKLTKDMLADVERMDAKEGDHAILVGMHVTTKEIPDWVWATFWWHDRPDNGVFAADRPAKLAGVWRNYLMNMAYSMETPREYDGSAHTCYNPWVELFPKGMGSNCMTCHQRALWPKIPIFPNRTKLDFMWSIALESK